MNTPVLLRNNKHQHALLVLETAINALATSTGIIGKVGKFAPANAHGPSRLDAELELSVDGRSYRYLVEIKHIDRVAMLHQLKQRFDGMPSPCLLVAPRISIELADKCRDFGIQFIDTDGNAHLQAPNMRVLVKGQRASKGSPFSEALGKGVRTGGASAARLVFVLLCVPELLNAPYRVLSQAAGVALGAIGPIFKDLANRGFINNAKNGRRFLEKEKLMNEWVTTYPIVLRPKLAMRRFRALERDWWKAVDIALFDAVWGGEVAADQLTGYLRPEKITIYMQGASMQQNLSKLVIQNKLRADPHGDIEVLEKFWELPAIGEATASSVPPVLAYADLVASMEPRNLEVASMISQHLNDAS